MDNQHEHEHKHDKKDSKHEDQKKKHWAANPINWIIALVLVLIGVGLVNYFTGDSPKAAPVATTAPTAPIEVPRGPSGGGQPNVVTIPNQPAPAGSTEVIVTAPKDYDVKVEVTEW